MYIKFTHKLHVTTKYAYKFSKHLVQTKVTEKQMLCIIILNKFSCKQISNTM